METNFTVFEQFNGHEENKLVNPFTNLFLTLFLNVVAILFLSSAMCTYLFQFGGVFYASWIDPTVSRKNVACLALVKERCVCITEVSQHVCLVVALHSGLFFYYCGYQVISIDR